MRMQRKGREMSDDLVRRLRTSPWCQPMKREAADRIEALEAALAKADELAGAVEFWTIAEEPDVSDAIYRLKRTRTAYRQARDATR